MTEPAFSSGKRFRGRRDRNSKAPDRPRGLKSSDQQVRAVPVYKEGVGDHPPERMANHELQEKFETAQGRKRSRSRCAK